MTPKEIEKFNAFLEKHGAKDKFYNNYNIKEPIAQYLEATPREDAITYAFSWVRSEEGSAFWSNLDKVWFKHV